MPIHPFWIIAIIVVVLIIFGPGRLPELGAGVGKAMRAFRKATSELTNDRPHPPPRRPPRAPPLRARSQPLRPTAEARPVAILDRVLRRAPREELPVEEQRMSIIEHL